MRACPFCNSRVVRPDGWIPPHREDGDSPGLCPMTQEFSEWIDNPSILESILSV